MQTGYFGVPGRADRSSKVHLVDEGKPLCGSRIGKDSKFQRCAGGAELRYVECKSCIKAYRNLSGRLTAGDRYGKT